MDCHLCRGYIYDFLTSPLMPCEPMANRIRIKRMKPCMGELIDNLIKIIYKVPENEYIQLKIYDCHMNGIRNYTPFILSPDDLIYNYHMNIRMYFYFRWKNPSLNSYFDYCLILLQEQYVLYRCQVIYHYEEFLSQKFIHLLEVIKMIHKEHSKGV
jgi:hypothetical protein